VLWWGGSAPQARPYVYASEDRSQITLWLSRRVAPRVDPLLPRILSPNQVTLTGSGLVLLLTGGVAFVPEGLRQMLAPLWVALLWGYCVLDHVDGFRARDRKMSSAWGEFLDHALDAIIVPAVILAVAWFVPAGAIRPWVAAAAIGGALVATVAVWSEQRAQGKLFLPAIGPVEGIAATGLFMLTWLIPGADIWWQTVQLGATRAELFLLASLLFVVTGLFTISRRTPDSLKPALMLAGFAVVLAAVAAARPEASLPLILAFALAGAALAARTIVAHLTGDFRPHLPLLGFGATLLASLPTAPGPALATLPWLAAVLLGGGALARDWIAAGRALRPRAGQQRSDVWQSIWRRKAATDDVPLHHVNGYDLLDQRGWDGMIADLAAKLRLRPGLEVIEFGCGAGAFLLSLARCCTGLRLNGIDYAPELVERARKSLPGGFSVGDMRASPHLPTAGFDLVCSFGTMMYLNSPAEAEKALDEMQRVLRPGGEIFLGEISDADRQEEAERLRRVTHADHRRVSADRPDHLYLSRRFFQDYAARHRLKAEVHDHRDLPFGASNPLASYRFSVILRAAA
jgi:ubiquinone/menaquinone biosynthesis C-methylase UbiE/phosphatidylglycerophosphate synthase